MDAYKYKLGLADVAFVMALVQGVWSLAYGSMRTDAVSCGVVRRVLFNAVLFNINRLAVVLTQAYRGVIPDTSPPVCAGSALRDWKWLTSVCVVLVTHCPGPQAGSQDE